MAVRFFQLLDEGANWIAKSLQLEAACRQPGRASLSRRRSSFLEDLSDSIIIDDELDENDEDEQDRLLCENLTARQRPKLCRQLYALGCRRRRKPWMSEDPRMAIFDAAARGLLEHRATRGIAGVVRAAPAPTRQRTTNAVTSD